MSKFGGKNKDSKAAAEKKMKAQLAALKRKNAKKHKDILMKKRRE